MLHPSTTRIKKDEAYRLIKRLYAGEELNHLEKSCLLLHFAPKVPKTPKNDLDFVRSGVAGKSEVRYYFQSICVRDGIAYSANGHYLRASPCDLPPGLYCARSMERTSDDDSRYPSLDAVMSTKGAEEIYDVTLEKTDIYLGEQVVKIGAFWYRMGYVQPVYEYLSGATILQDTSGKLLFVVDGIVRAVIMNMNINR